MSGFTNTRDGALQWPFAWLEGDRPAHRNANPLRVTQLPAPVFVSMNAALVSTNAGRTSPRACRYPAQDHERRVLFSIIEPVMSAIAAFDITTQMPCSQSGTLLSSGSTPAGYPESNGCQTAPRGGDSVASTPRVDSRERTMRSEEREGGRRGRESPSVQQPRTVRYASGASETRLIQGKHTQKAFSSPSRNAK